MNNVVSLRKEQSSTHTIATAAAALVRNGYAPVPIKPGTKRPDLLSWSKIEIDERTVEDWKSTGRGGHGVGLRCDLTPGIDLDISDESVLGDLLDWCDAALGVTCRRTGRPPRVLLPYRCDAPFPKISSAKYESPDGNTHQIEILGKGNQFVAFAIHPDTNKPYAWEGGDPLRIPAVDLPTLTPEMGWALIAHFESIVPATWKLVSRASAPSTAEHKGNPKKTADLRRLRSAFEVIPNEDRDWSSWKEKFMLALWSAVGEQKAEGFAIIDEWSSKHPKYDPERTLAEWEGITGIHSIGAGTIFYEAYVNGWIDPGEDTTAWMEAVDDIPLSAPVEDTGEPANDNVAADVAPRNVLRTISAAKLAGVSVPPRAWHVPDLIPAGNVTLLSGDGGTGKSQVALQLAAAGAMGEAWLGLNASAGPALFLSAEDDLDELHRRLACIMDSYDRPFEDVENLHLASLAGEDALLAAPEAGRSNILKPTALFGRLDRTIAEIKPSLVVLDTLADLFGGDEIQRAQARPFIGLMRQFCLRHATTVLLLAHPSLSGLNSGTGSSGSTAWSNSVRSRLYLKRAEGNADVRVLETQKANYGPVGNQLEIRWSRGVFIRHGHGDATVNAADEQARAEDVFLRLLDAYAEEGRPVSPSPSNAYAPTRFAADKRAEGLSKSALAGAMNGLFQKKIIRSSETGPDSKRRCRIIRA